MKRIEDMKIKIFADGADKAGMLEIGGYDQPNPDAQNRDQGLSRVAWRRPALSCQ